MFNLGSELSEVSEELRKAVDDMMPQKLREASFHFLGRGKNTRAALVLLAFKTISRSTAFHRVIPAAAAIEMIHVSSLVHDDIIDKSSKRRGLPTVHEKFGANIALLVGDVLLAKAYSLVAIPYQLEPAVVTILHETTIKMTEGEAMELEMGGDINWDQYMLIVEHKTASLVEASTRMGAVLAGGSDDQVKTLTDYGRFLGTAYQIQDDILDKVGGDETGKTTQNDDAQNKPNAVTVLGSLETARGKLAEYATLAKECLADFEDSYGKDGLLQLVDFVVSRDH